MDDGGVALWQRFVGEGMGEADAEALGEVERDSPRSGFGCGVAESLRVEEKAKEEFTSAYNYLRDRTQMLRYAAYKRVGIPCGSGVTEAACKTIYTQRLKLSGMRWKKPGGQTILNLRVMLLSEVWMEAYRRVMKNANNVIVPAYDVPARKGLAKAA